MSNSVFQSVIVQLRDISDRVFGVIDTEGCVISSTDMSLLGERWPDAALKVGNASESIVTFAQKSFKAKGKRLTTWKIESIEELEPTRFPDPEAPSDDDASDEQEGAEEPRENLDPDAGKSEQQVIDELTGQTNLFSDKDFTEDDKDREWLSKQ